MSNIYPIKAGFRGGYISPSARGRVDSTEYALGLGACDNWIVTPQSSLQFRYGTKFVSQLDSDTLTARLIAFPSGNDETKLVEMDGKKIKIYGALGQIRGKDVWNKDPNFASGALIWKQGGGGSNSKWVLTKGSRLRLSVASKSYIGSNSLNQIYVWQQIKLPADTYTVDFSYASETRVDAYDGTKYDKCPMFLYIGTTNGAFNIFKGQYVGGAWGNPTKFQAKFTLATETTVYVRMGLDKNNGINGTNQGAIYAPFAIRGTANNLIEFNSPWDETQIAQVQYATDAGLNEMYFAHPLVEPQVLKYDNLSKVWTFEAVTFTAKPIEWVSGNYPAVVALFQSRLWLGGTPLQPTNIWASRTGAYKNFTIGANAKDGLAFDVSTTGAFRWFLGRDFLLIGTNEGEWVLGAANTVVTPNDYYFAKQTGYGCSRVQPVYIGQQICYSGINGTKVRVTNSSLEAQGWIGMDISLAANELILSGVKELHYASDPNYTLFGVTEGRTLACCTYDKNNQLLAWYEMSPADGGEVISVAVTTELGGDALWAIIKRNGILSLEVMQPYGAIQQFMDSYTVQPVVVTEKKEGGFSLGFSSGFQGGYVDGYTIKKVVTGLEYLEGMTVGIVYNNVDNATGVITKQLAGTGLVSNGELIVPNFVNAGDCAVGLIYKAYAETLPQEGGNKLGTSQGSKRKWNRIFSRLYRSCMPIINGYRPTIPASLINRPAFPLETIVTGDFEVRNEGFDGGIVTIENDQPLPCEISAIFGKSQSSET